MKFQAKLMTAFGAVALITLGVSLLGFWQASRLGSALYEVGVVRLPSIEGLTLIVRAKAALDASAQTLVIPGETDTTVASELDHQTRMWARAAQGRAIYEPLPQTPEEAAAWKTFVPAWAKWKANYDAAIALVVEGDHTGSDALRVKGQQALAAAAPGSRDVDALLAKLATINENIVATAKQHSVASYQDLALVRNVMLIAGLLSVFGAVAAGFFLGRRLSQPLVRVAASLSRIAEGEAVPPLAVSSKDEIGGIAAAVNRMVERQRETEVARGIANEALRKSEEKFFKVFMSAPVGISVSGLTDARIIETNDQFLNLLGYSRDEVVGRTSIELGIWPDPAVRHALADSVRAHNEVPSEQQLRAKNGEIRTVRAASHKLDLDGTPVMVSAVADVTDQRRAEAERRHSERMYRELVDGARDVIIAVTPEGILTALNPAFEHVLGWPREQWIGQPFAGLVVPDDVPKALAQFQAALNDEPRPITQIRTRTADGNMRIAEIYLATQREHDKIVGLLGIARDVTDRVQLEEQFHQAQKMEAIGRLAGGVAHDFNNLLTAILGYCELLLVDLNPADAQHADITEIQKAGTRAAGLTRQLLAFSRKQIIEPTQLDLNAIVADIRPMLGRLIGEDVTVVLDLHRELGAVKADHGQVEQVILNLAVNARDAMPDGGTLTFKTANAELDAEYAATHIDVKPGAYVALTVSDTGTGMTPEVRARLFEPFFTTKGVGKGTGLGLATVHGIVSRGGGSVGIDSEVGKGTSFHVYFPRVDARETAVDAAPVAHRPHAGGETILVVEDADGLRQLTTRLLRRLGYQVLVARDAKEAVTVFDANSAIDVLLTDVVMPGASGPELTRQLIDKRPLLKVIYMSGYTEETIVQHGVLNPGIAFLNKPFSSDALGLKIREVLDR